MESRMQTGLLLILGTIVATIGWIGFYPADGTESAVEQANKLMADPNIATVGIILGFGGMIAVFIGLLNICRSMVTIGGKGSPYANIATVLFMALIAGSILAAGLELGTTKATLAASGGALMDVSVALSGSAQITMGIALILLGVASALHKNFHIIAAALGVITGVMLIASSFTDSAEGLGWLLQLVGWIGFPFTALVLGGLTIRSKN